MTKLIDGYENNCWSRRLGCPRREARLAAWPPGGQAVSRSQTMYVDGTVPPSS
ncbi:hypothetical protein [Mycobacterium sp. URHB0021]